VADGGGLGETVCRRKQYIEGSWPAQGEWRGAFGLRFLWKEVEEGEGERYKIE
jgi:hypothetical protein